MKKTLLIILFATLPAWVTLLQPGYFPMHDNLQPMRQKEMDICFKDGQIPCRWVPDMGNQFGYPLFNYYPPLPYLLGEVFTHLGSSYIDTIKIVSLIGFLFAAMGMFYLVNNLWGKNAGILSAIFYTYAPYHSVDLYVRGAVNEFWALAWYPWIFYGFYKLIRQPTVTRLVFSSLCLTGLMLSHNQMFMIFSPFLLVWIVYWSITSKSIKTFVISGLSGLLSLGLAAFYTLPVVFEQKYVHIESLIIGYFNYLAHFLDIKQIFFRINWGYGGSTLGPNDTMSFALGYMHWIIPSIVLIFFIFVKSLRVRLPIILFLAGSLALSLFLTHSRSDFIWSHIPALSYLQFPWRFLTLSIFFASFLSAAVVFISRKIPFISLCLALTIFLNANYFQPQDWFPKQTDAEIFTGQSWSKLITASIFDYLPINAPLPPPNPAIYPAIVTNGKATVSQLAKNSWSESYSVDVQSDSAIVQIQKFYFPNWQVKIDDQQYNINPSADPELGRIEIPVSNGQHSINLFFANTPIRTFSNTLSLIFWLSILLWFAFVVWAKITRWTPKSSWGMLT